jgi:CrcB protein
MNGYWLVFLGAGLGGMARLGLGGWLSGLSSNWPLATFFVNCLGAFLMGLLMVASPILGLGEGARLGIGVGFLGGFTTFSAFSAELFQFIESGQWGRALIYGSASVIISLFLIIIGHGLGKRIFS